MRHLLVLATMAATTAVGAQAPSAGQDLAGAIRRAEAEVTLARPRTIKEAEREAASYPRMSTAADAAPARTCTTVTPDQIALPTSHGDPQTYRVRSGEFEAGSISFGWGGAPDLAKMPLTPQHPETIGAGLWVRVIRLDKPGEGPAYALDALNPSAPFFPAWLRLPTAGTWMILTTAGANWGCFVLDRPLKLS